jgi:hypothetical protein
MADLLTGVQDGAQLSRLQQGYQRAFGDIQAVAREGLVAITLDVGSVYTLATAALLRVRPYRQDMLSLPFLKRELVEKAEDYLLALGHAQALYIAATAPVASLPELFNKLIKSREILLADANALAKRGLIPEDRLQEMRGPMGHSQTAFDVLGLCSLLRAHWPNIQGKTALLLSDVEQAETLSDSLLSAVGERKASDAEASGATLNRQKAYTLFMQAYEEVRRALAYLRYHEGDVDELAPSLYTLRKPRKRKDGEADEVDASEAPAPVTAKSAAHKPTNGTPASDDLEGSPFIQT